MPTYSATGITATLSVADLASSVTKSIDLRTGALPTETKRIEKVFAQGTRLRERPIGRDGSEYGVVQFIGDDGDLPCFIVEASERSKTTASRGEWATSMDLSDQEAIAARLLNKESPMMTADSPLTSLANTPSTGARPFKTTFSRCGTPTKGIAPPDFHSLEDTTAGLTDVSTSAIPHQQPRAPQALMLEVETCKRSFPQKLNRKRGEMPVPDMKIELFMNGQLVNTHFVNYQRLGTDHKHKFSGTRVHRQADKPWAYQTFDQAGSSDITAEQRWAAVNDQLVDHMKLRGADKQGRLPPTVQYMHALSKLAFPDRLKDCSNLGIFDVIITTGKGSKYGPIRGYLTEPQPMASTRFGHNQIRQGANEEDDAFVETSLPRHLAGIGTSFGTEKTSALSSFNTVPVEDRTTDDSALLSDVSGQLLPSTSPAIPLARRPRSAIVDQDHMLPNDEAIEGMAETTTGKRNKTKIQLLAEDLGISPDKMTMSRQWHNAKGRRSLCKTVAERLNDIRKMSLENQELAIAEVLEAVSSNMPGSSLRIGVPQKKARMARRDSKVQSEYEVESTTAVNSPADDIPVAGAIPAQDQVLSRQEVLDNPSAVAAQHRMDMLIDRGASPEGRLAERISSLSSNHKPTKKALPPPSPLDMGPPPSFGMPARSESSSSPVKKRLRQDSGSHNTETMVQALTTLSSPHKQSKIAESPFKDEAHMLAQHQHEELDTKIPEGTAKGIPRKKKSGPGRRKRLAPSQQSLPHENGSEEALTNFQPPKLCKGSVLTYAGPGMQRQINKSRPGIFDEEEFVVGMRFFVT